MTETGRTAVLVGAIDTARKVRKLIEKVHLLNDLIESLHNEYRKEAKRDEERLRRLEQAVHRLEQGERCGASGAGSGSATGQPAAQG